MQCRRLGFDPWVRKIPWKRKWQPTPVFLPEKSHGQRSLVSYYPKGCSILGVRFHLALGFSVALTKFPAHLFIRDFFNIQHFEASFSHGRNGGFVRQMDIELETEE